jgi:hypothetical protein
MAYSRRDRQPGSLLSSSNPLVKVSLSDTRLHRQALQVSRLTSCQQLRKVSLIEATKVNKHNRHRREESLGRRRRRHARQRPTCPTRRLRR